MQELIEQHLALFLQQKADTQVCRRRVLQELAQFFAERPLSEWTRQHLEGYHQHLIWQPGPKGLRSDNTICQMMLMSRRFLRWLVEQGRLSEECVKNWRFGAPRKRPERLLSRDQVQAILEGPNAHTPIGMRNRAIFSVICELGLMSQACVNLDVRELDLTTYRLAGKRIGAGLAEKLERYLRQGRPVLLVRPEETALFLSREGNRPVQMSICKAIDACVTSGKVSPRLLHRSWKAHREALLSKRLAGI